MALRVVLHYYAVLKLCNVVPVCILVVYVDRSGVGRGRLLKYCWRPVHHAGALYVGA